MDDRALEFVHLLPSPAEFTVVDAPVEIERSLSALSVSGGARVLVLWQGANGTSDDLSEFDAVAIINPQRESRHLSGFGKQHRYAIVPGLSDPRWFVPLASGTVAAKAFALYQPFKPMARLKRGVVRLLARIGAPGWYRDSVLVFTRQSSPLESMVRDAIDIGDVHLTISTGTLGPARKLTIGVMNNKGVMRSIFKLAETPIARTLLKNEASNLKFIRSEKKDLIKIPNILVEQELGDCYLLGQSVLAGRPTGNRFTNQHSRFLKQPNFNEMKPALTTSLVGSFEGRIARLGISDPNMETALTDIYHLLRDTMVRRTIVHGDFAPWNLRRDSYSMGAFDWEYGHLDGLPLLDEIHHHLQTGYLLKSWSNNRALQYLHEQTFQSDSGLLPRQVRGVQTAYLLDVILRRHEEGHPPNDEFRTRYDALLSGILIDTLEQSQ